MARTKSTPLGASLVAYGDAHSRLGRERPIFSSALMSTPNVGPDAAYERRDAADGLLHFMRNAEPAGESFNLKKMIEEGRA